MNTPDYLTTRPVEKPAAQLGQPVLDQIKREMAWAEQFRPYVSVSIVILRRLVQEVEAARKLNHETHENQTCNLQPATCNHP